MNRRAVSPVLGLALLVGLVAVASVSLLLVTTAITDNTQSSIDDQRAEQSLSKLAGTADALAKGDIAEGRYAVQGASNGRFRAIPYDGDEVSIRVADGSDSTVFTINRTLGSVLYAAPDGSQIAYQGGGVWRLDDDGEAVMVQPPEFHYRDQPEPTLTYPLVLVREDFSATGSASGAMTARETRRHYPDEPNHYNPLVNGSVTISIDSLYCEGWESFFRDRTGGSVTESCESQGITSDSEVRIELSVPFEIDGFQNGAMFNGNVDGSHIDGTYHEGGHAMRSPTRMVKSQVEACEDGEGTDVTHGGDIEGPGLYCIDSDAASDGQDFSVNATGGDVEIAIDGPIPHDGGLEVDGTGNVSLFVDGDLFESPGQGNAVFGNESDPSQTRIYVASGNDVEANAVDIYALLYAPTSDVRVQGQFDMEGGIIANDADFKGNSEVSIDPSVLDVSASFQPADANLYFLHISETEVVFEED